MGISNFLRAYQQDPRNKVAINNINPLMLIGKCLRKLSLDTEFNITVYTGTYSGLFILSEKLWFFLTTSYRQKKKLIINRLEYTIVIWRQNRSPPQEHMQISKNSKQDKNNQCFITNISLPNSCYLNNT